MRFRKTFKADDNPTITLRFAPNFASTTQGAQATGDAAPFTNPAGTVVQPAPTVLKNLIDDSEASDWQAAATQGADGLERRRRAGDDRSAGSRPETICHSRAARSSGRSSTPRRADVSENRFTALREFEIWTCNDQAADCSGTTATSGPTPAHRTSSRPTRRAGGADDAAAGT